MIKANPIVDVIFGGQYGSEGKRLFNEYYYQIEKPDAIVSNFGPNSGGFISDGSKWATFAMGANCLHMLSPGSIISIDDFYTEKDRLPEGAEIIVHENAAVVTPRHLNEEMKFVRVGSTMTGTAAAVLQKMERDPLNMSIARDELPEYVVSAREWVGILSERKKIQLSVPQGHSLSINHGFYPYCTSRNTSPQQALADAGIPIQWVNRIIACMRTFPIRVSNRYDEDGNMIGWSGPCYGDQQELTWKDVGQPPEMTSVSKKVRRVFSFSVEQYVESCISNGVTNVFLNFANYLSRERLKNLLGMLIANRLPPITWLGYGPKTSDIATMRMMTPEDEIDGRIGCHPTIMDLNEGSAWEESE